MSENKHVFISYSSKDIEFVKQIAREMDKEGIVYWKAPDNIPAGSNYAKEIPKAIRECGLFLLIYSENSQQSIWVEKEIDTAICEHKNILPVRIENCEFSDLFKFYLNNVQMFDAIKRDDVIINLSLIIDKIEELLDMEQSKINNAELKGKIQVFSDGNSNRRNVDKRSNALRMNRIPLECEYCGSDVELQSIGVYRCVKCGRDNYDDFYKVRSYIEKYGPAPAIVISRSTGVSRASIEYFKNS